jgi:mRNA-degrading endonuclease RelE of RelBE toxin-antitoxin system
MKLLIARQAEKKLERMQPKVARAILEALKAIAAEPFAGHPNVKPLKGFKDAFRLRRADWRAVYRIDRAAGLMIVEIVETRGQVHK